MEMKSCNSPEILAGTDDVFWVESRAAAEDENAEEAVYSIGDLARKFNVTLRTLRFYESRGLLSPGRQGHHRRYSRNDADRLTVILKAKKLGFTLTEIREMIAAESGEASRRALKLSRTKCLEQIALFERKLAETEEALAELRWIYTSLSARMVDDTPCNGPA
jgi:DNA-binding transcriptional MerR regulator